MRAEASILPLNVHRLSYAARCGTMLLSDITLQVMSRRQLVVLGPNGAGKTLLLRLCHGLIEPSRGRIEWSVPERARLAQAMVFQRPVLLRRSVRANLRHTLSLAGFSRARNRARTEEAIARFGLENLAERSARLLSGGEQQRLAIARAWVLRPEVLFLDEPTGQLDPTATHSVEAMIQAISAEGVTVVMSTHDLGQARRVADDVAFLHRGRLIEFTPAAEFFSDPKSTEARAFLAGELLW